MRDELMKLFLDPNVCFVRCTYSIRAVQVREDIEEYLELVTRTSDIVSVSSSRRARAYRRRHTSGKHLEIPKMD